MPTQQTMEHLRADLAQNMKQCRKTRGVSQERLAVDAEVDRTVVLKNERCVGNPRLDTLLKLANRLNTPSRAHAPVRDAFGFMV